MMMMMMIMVRSSVTTLISMPWSKQPRSLPGPLWPKYVNKVAA